MSRHGRFESGCAEAIGKELDRGGSCFGSVIENLSNSQILRIETVEDPVDLPPVPERLGIGWMPTVHRSPSTFAVLSLGEIRLVAAMFPPSLFEGRVDQTRAVVWWSMDEPHHAVTNGVRFPTDALFFGGPGARCQAYWPVQAGPSQTTVAIVVPWTRASSRWPASGPLFANHLVDSIGLTHLRNLSRDVFRRASDQPESLIDPARRAARGTELFDAVTDLFATGRPIHDPQSELKQRYVATLDRIDRLIEERLDRPILLDDVAAELRLAPRSIHNIMKSMRGMTLQTHVKILKLRSIRRALLRDETCDLVKQVALMHGYTHYGRLAQEYARFFGESPSATLLRKRR